MLVSKTPLWLTTLTYSIADDKIFAFDLPFLRPGGCWPRFYELSRLAWEIGVFLDAFEGNLIPGGSAMYR